MSTKTVKTRVRNKHETKANWDLATNFVPLAGELIIYDSDSTHAYPRFKIGDGTTTVVNLPFLHTLGTGGNSNGDLGDITVNYDTGVVSVKDDSHTHDSRYYTESEINTKINTINAAIAAVPDTGATSVEVTGTGNAITTASYSASTRKLTLTKGATYNNYSLPAAGSSLGGVKSGGDVSISSGLITVNDDSHNHVIGNVDGLQARLVGFDASLEELAAGKADRDQGVFYIEGSGTTDTTNKVATWTGSHINISAYYNGLTILYKISTAGSTTTTLNINNLGAVNVVKNATTAISTSYPVSSVVMLIYTTDSDGTAYWKCVDYDANTKTTTGTSNKASTKLYLAGATSQSSSGATTYSNSKVYIGTDNHLYSNAKRVLNTDDKDTHDAAFAEHVANSIHITSAERTNWNGAKTHATSPHAPSDAEKNVQSDWSVTDTSSDAYIKNKPTIYNKTEIDNKVATINAAIAAKPSADTNTTYDLATTKSSTNGNVKLNLTAGGSGSGTDSVTLKGTGTTTVTTDANGIVTINSTAHPTALKNPNALTIGGKSYDGSAAVSVSAADLGIANAVHFIGETTTALTDGTTTAAVTISGASKTPAAGDVVLYGSKEFIWTGSAWKELGDGSSYALKTVTITAGNGLTGGGAISANRTLAVGAGNGITVSADAVAAKAGNGITVDSTGISHADTSSQASVTANGRKYITGVTLDAYGHVTGLTTGTETVVNTDTDTGATSIEVTGSGNAVTAASYNASTRKITLTKGATYNNYSLPTASSSTLGGVKIGSNISISSGKISVPTANGTTAGVTVVYPAASCTTFSSDSGTVTPKAVQKGAKMFAITRPSASTANAVTRYSNTTGDVKDSKITIEDVTNTRDTTKTANVLVIPAEGNKKMVYGYCTDQVDGTSFIGGVFDASATTYPYSAGLAIGGTTGNLLWKGNRVLDGSDLTTINNSISGKAPAYQYSTTDLTAGTSALTTGKLYFVYE